jgi:mannose-6-phosphate isomerase-like protein (cupin superfamily)
MKSFNIADEFVVLSPDKVAYTVVNSPTVYQDLAREFGDFKGHEIIALHEFHEDWSSWEVHPNGDETVVLLSGSATFVIKLGGSDHEVTLNKPGDTVIVPTAAWHTARITEPTNMLFITPGEGTLNEYDTAE